ncbi:cupin domain-containing protein [Terriglobus saanensis]|uniref:Cupin 2 conserved barrel domain protein n=1 Tax=Terriglobus saanensis (strain ATCC BAA-1853 / DSM 23119 / SP1PR4) TaxID=401053 RepID=E8UZF0_TERSS|nr:cupin domain-containing protein [Terriglobus saanensis]ADV83230.1 Cupin 2 conserved barrel domain protein [Terriglobus saanensis SP1PR4]
MSENSSDLKAFKRAPSVENSKWYKGILITQLASEKETGGDYDLTVTYARRGTEPPPHVHSRENEFFYVLEGELTAYVGKEIFQVEAGAGLFMPRGVPHAVRSKSPETRLLVLITPGGFMHAINEMAAPAEKLEIPADDAVTYASGNLENTMKIFEKYGIHLLMPEEIAQEMPAYPMPRVSGSN